MGQGVTCKECAGRQSQSIYQTSCLTCCARLVATTRPDKALAMAMLAAIERNKDAPKRAAILEKVKEMER